MTSKSLEYRIIARICAIQVYLLSSIRQASFAQVCSWKRREKNNYHSECIRRTKVRVKIALAARTTWIVMLKYGTPIHLAYNPFLCGNFHRDFASGSWTDLPHTRVSSSVQERQAPKFAQTRCWLPHEWSVNHGIRWILHGAHRGPDPLMSP